MMSWIDKGSYEMSYIDELEDDDQIQRVIPDEQEPPYVPPLLPARDADTPVPASEMSNSDILKGYYGGGISPSDDPQYEKVKEQAAKSKLYAQLGEAADTIGHAIGGRSDLQDNTFYRNLAKESDQPVKDYVGSRALVQKYLQNKYSNNLKEKGLSLREKGLAQQELNQNELRRISEETKNAANETRNLQIEGRKDDKQTKKEEKLASRFILLGDALDPNKGRVGEFGEHMKRVDAADRLLVLKEQHPDMNFDGRQMEEVAIATANLLSGGSQAAQATIHNLLAKSGMGNVNELIEWLTNKPRGKGQQAFARRMMETAEREKDLAQYKIKGIRFSRIAQHGDLENADPRRFENVLRSKEVDPDEYRAYAQSGYKMAPRMGGGPTTKVVGNKTYRKIGPNQWVEDPAGGSLGDN